MMSPYVALPENMNRCWHTAAFTSAAMRRYCCRIKVTLVLTISWLIFSEINPVFPHHYFIDCIAILLAKPLFWRSKLNCCCGSSAWLSLLPGRRQGQLSRTEDSVAHRSGGSEKNCGSTGVEIWWELMRFKGISFGYMMVYPLVV